MIKLTDEQAVRLDMNIGEVMNDLRTAVFEESEDATFLSVGANIGMALQKLHDIRVFLCDQTSKHKPPLVNISNANDPWEEPVSDMTKQEAEELKDYLDKMLASKGRIR